MFARWLKVFPMSQIKVVLMEEYAVNRTTVLNDIFRFLDIGKTHMYNNIIADLRICIYVTFVVVCTTRGFPCQHGVMCGCKQWSNDVDVSNYNMQSITIQFAVRVLKTIRISTEYNIIQIDLPDGSTKLSTKRNRTESAESPSTNKWLRRFVLWASTDSRNCF